MWNGIIIPMLLIMEFFSKSLTKSYIFQFTMYKHTGVSESIDFDNRNFSNVKPQQSFHFFYTVIFYSSSALKRIIPIFQIF